MTGSLTGGALTGGALTGGTHTGGLTNTALSSAMGHQDPGTSRNNAQTEVKMSESDLKAHFAAGHVHKQKKMKLKLGE